MDGRLGREPLPLRELKPPLRTASSTESYAARLVTMATLAWFLAEAPHNRRAADIDLLDAVVLAGARHHRVGKG